MKLGDVLGIISKENGFYITDLRDKSGLARETFFQDSDDFYEKPYAKYMYDCEVVWFESKNNKLNLLIK